MATPTDYEFGQDGSVAIGPVPASSGTPPVTVCLKEWSATYDFGVQNLTTTCSEGFQDLGTGIQSLEVSFSGFYNATQGNLKMLTTGAVIACEFFLGNSGSSFAGQFLVKSIKWTNPATEYIDFECTVGSSGAIVITEPLAP
jgi:hypothetical protein